MTTNAGLVELIDAIERRDSDAVERLRERVREEHIAPLIATWRKSLPWPAKSLYVALLMDQRLAAIEPLMIDALAAPAVETRAYAVSYLAGSLASFERLLGSGGFLDEEKVAEAIARWRAESGIAKPSIACSSCGAPGRDAAPTCRYCGAGLRSAEPFPDGGSVRWVLTLGEPSKERAVVGEGTVLTSSRVTMRLRAPSGLSASKRLNVQIFKRDGSDIRVVAVGVLDLAPPARELQGSWDVGGEGTFDFRVVEATTREVLASQRFVVGKR